MRPKGSNTSQVSNEDRGRGERGDGTQMVFGVIQNAASWMNRRREEADGVKDSECECVSVCVSE